MNSIQTIGSNAFANCTNLQIVKIPSRLYDKCNFNYFTSEYVTKNGAVYKYVYDQGFLLLEDGTYALVIKKDYID